jgi:sec-independent protein translocase protein TatB
MFDIGISEFAVIGAVALVVLGPERLPKVARTAGHLFGRLQRYVNTVKADINREMETSELANLKKEVQDAARSFEQTVNQTATSIESEARVLQNAANEMVAEAKPAAVATPEAALSSNPTSGHAAVNLAVNPATAPEVKMPSNSAPIGEFEHVKSGSLPAHNPNDAVQGMLDFGIEPSRRAKLK